MKTAFRKAVGFLAILYVISGLFSFLDLVLSLFIRPNAVRTVRSAFVFFAHDAIANYIAIVCVGAVLVALVAVSAKVFQKLSKTREFPLHIVYGTSASILLVSVVGGLLNFTVLGGYKELESIIGNLVLLTSLPITAVLFSLTAKKLGTKTARTLLRTSSAAISAAVTIPIVVGYAFYWSGGTHVERESPGAPNVLIITIDALRNDHVSYSGYDSVETPVIDGFAENGVIFSDCHTNSPWTIPSLFTMLTSRYPSTHGAHFAVRGSDELTTVAEILRENGYDTEAYVANTVLDGELGFDRGFSRYVRFEDWPPIMWVSKSNFYFVLENYRDQMAQWGCFQTTPWITEILCKSLEAKRERPFFIWAHYFDPHQPLNPPEKFIEGDPGFLEKAKVFMKNQTPNLLPADKDVAVPLYRSEVRYVDDSLKRVFNVLEEKRLYENTLIFISSDHGEELFEHGHYGHGETHYDEVLAIPMVVYAPDLENGRCDYPVSLVDVMPTVLDYAGIETATVVKGKNMLGLIGKAPGGFDRGVVYAEGTISDLSTRSVYVNPYILIREGEGRYEYEMVDVRLRGGADDIIGEPTGHLFEKYRVLLDDLAAAAAREAAFVGGEGNLRLSKTERDRLRNLGYF
jgi:choline-sulfatase